MLDVQTIGVLVTAASVSIAAIYYMLTLKTNQRNLSMNLETRQSQFMSQISDEINSLENWKIAWELLGMEWTDWEDFERKYGSDYNLDNFAMRNSAWNGYDLFSAMLRDGLVDAETLYNSVTTGPFMLWAKLEDVIREQRRRYVGVDYLANFEYLAKEMLRIKLQRDPSYKMPETFIKYVPDN
jgi:hypothetical protein